MTKITGYLVVNEFINSEKFNELFSLLLKAAEKQDIVLIKKTGGCLWVELALSNYQVPEEIDFVLFWDKDIKLARALENTGIWVLNSSKAIENCDDKAKTYIELKKHKDIVMPKTFISPKKFHADGNMSEVFINGIGTYLGYPCIVKECMGSFGAQVYMAQDEAGLKRIITEIGKRDYMVQEFISSSAGRDVRIQVVGKEVAAAMYRYNDDDFRANITNGGSMKAYEPNAAQKETALAVCEYLGLDFAGVDILFGKNDEPIVCEVNSNAHFKNLLDCTGINVAEKIMGYIKEQIVNRK